MASDVGESITMSNLSNGCPLVAIGKSWCDENDIYKKGKSILIVI